MLRLWPPRARLAPLAGIFYVLCSCHAPAELPLRKYSERATEPAKGAGGGEFGQFLLSVWAAHWLGARAARAAGSILGSSSRYGLLARRSARVPRGRWAGPTTASSRRSRSLRRARTASCGIPSTRRIFSSLAASPVSSATLRRGHLLLSAWRFYKPRMASEDKILRSSSGDAGGTTPRKRRRRGSCLLLCDAHTSTVTVIGRDAIAAPKITQNNLRGYRFRPEHAWSK